MFQSHGLTDKQHCVKSVRIWSYSGSYLPTLGLRYLSVFSLNAGKYEPE